MQRIRVQLVIVDGARAWMRAVRPGGRWPLALRTRPYSYAGAEALAPESKRLGRAKDYIADEQWPRAIEELRAAVADPKEPRQDEALYWLAHSLNQSGDQASAVETIGRLERDFPSSMWVKPARSLRIEIAVRLNRSDVCGGRRCPPPAPRRAPCARQAAVAAHQAAGSHRRRRRILVHGQVRRPRRRPAHSGARRTDEDRCRESRPDPRPDRLREREPRPGDAGGVHAGAVLAPDGAGNRHARGDDGARARASCGRSRPRPLWRARGVEGPARASTRPRTNR